MSTKSTITACQEWYKKSAHYFYTTFLKPKSDNEDNKRSERILTIILSVAVIVTFLFEVILLVIYFTSDKYSGVPIPVYTFILIVFWGLYYATRTGYYKTSGYLFICILLSSAIYTSYMWGASLPMGLLTYGLIVTIASIVINSRFGFLIAIVSCVAIVITGLYEHSNHIIPVWKQVTIEKRDVIGYGIMIVLTALLSRLSNKEMEKSLQRARASEQDLKIERDNLEITVLERTKALRESERERMRELYRFAEFGKLSGGIFHDLLNPLTAVSLSVQKLSNETAEENTNQEVVDSLKTAVSATRKMEQFMATVRKQLQSNDMRGLFSLNDEVEDAIELIAHKAKKANASIIFESDEKYELHGNPLKYNQVITNLLINAIDAGATKIILKLSANNDSAICTVSDNGSGIESSVVANIFTPFFTTKEKGIGLGLSTTKDIIEEHFNGTIDCQSEIGKGTEFTIVMPTPNETHTGKQNSTSVEFS